VPFSMKVLQVGPADDGYSHMPLTVSRNML
jgi:hypothetical protein